MIPTRPMILLLLIATASLAMPAAAADLTILYNASVRAELRDCGCKSKPLGGLARRAAFLAAHDRDDALLLDAGNLFGDPSRDTAAASRLVARAAAAMGYDAVGVGPFDIGHGIDFVREVATNTGLRFVSANVEIDGRLAFEPYAIVERAGEKIGVISVCDPAFARAPYDTHLGDVHFVDPEAALERWLPELRERVDLVVLLSNMERDRSVDLLRAFSGRADARIDVVVEGVPTRAFRRARSVDGTRVVAANDRGKYVGEIVIDFDATGIVQDRVTLHELTLDLPEDADLAAAVDELDRRAEDVASTR